MLLPLIASIAALIAAPVLGFCGARAYINITRGNDPDVHTKYAVVEVLSAVVGLIVPLFWISHYVSRGDESVWMGVLFLCGWSLVGAFLVPGGMGMAWCIECIGKALARLVDRLTLPKAEGQ